MCGSALERQSLALWGGINDQNFHSDFPCETRAAVEVRLNLSESFPWVTPVPVALASSRTTHSAHHHQCVLVSTWHGHPTGGHHRTQQRGAPVPRPQRGYSLSASLDWFTASYTGGRNKYYRANLYTRHFQKHHLSTLQSSVLLLVRVTFIP